jgi:hypothetical protein
LPGDNEINQELERVNGGDARAGLSVRAVGGHSAGLAPHRADYSSPHWTRSYYFVTWVAASVDAQFVISERTKRTKVLSLAFSARAQRCDA